MKPVCFIYIFIIIGVLLITGCKDIDDTLHVPHDPINIAFEECVPDDSLGPWVYDYQWLKVTYDIHNGIVTQSHETDCMKVY